MQRLRYEIVDVFTDRPFTGNPLAVVFGAESLSTGQMQSLAREFHLSETVFVLEPVAPEATYRARIFTPETELPFAGHPSVGAAVTVSRRDGLPAGDVVQECGAGLLPIRVYDGGKARLTGGTPTVGPELDPAPLLAAVGLTADDYAGPAPRVAGCGLDFPYLSVRADAVRRAAGDPHTALAHGIPQVSVLHWDAAEASAHARVFCPGLAVPEDPATGSAALGLGVWLVESGLLGGSGDHPYRIRQGVEMLRPSTLDCTVTASGGHAVAATVAGHVVAVAAGEIAVPPFVG
jgi:trans-2,3-dihydro-3-hydroxyanthranilate isomerase